MSTADAARAVGLDGILGTLEEGMLADIAIFSYSSTPYKPMIEANPLDTKAALFKEKLFMAHKNLVEKLRQDRDFL